MAKYKDPNTGVKYSTHTGLKVFTVIVVILLVISIVLNVVLYTQNSDDSKLDTGESGEFDDGYGNGENGEGNVGDEDDGGSSQNSGSSSNQGSSKSDDSENDEPPAASQESEDENLESSSDDEELPVVVNEYVTRTSKYNPLGIANCLYYYEDCSICDGDCVGHDMYMTMGGGVYDFYPNYDDPLEPTSYAADEEEIQVTLIFYVYYGKKDDFVGGRTGLYYEISPLSGDAVNVKSIKIDQDLTYTVSWEHEAIAEEYAASYTLKETAESNKYVRIYETEQEILGTSGHFTLSVELEGGSEYVYEFKYIDDNIWADLMSEEDRAKEKAEQEELQKVESENDRFEASDAQDENGVTKGRYYYNDCSKCSGSTCSGHTMYRSANGGYYDFYPYTETLTLTDEEGNEDINSEMQVSLVYEEKPTEHTTIEGIVCIYGLPDQIEISSLTEDALDIGSIDLRKHMTLSLVSFGDSDGVSGALGGTNVEDGVKEPLAKINTSTETSKNYEIEYSASRPDGYYILHLTMSDGTKYTCDYFAIADSDKWDAIIAGNISINWYW